MYKVKAQARELLIYGDIGTDPWAEQSVGARDIIDALDDLTGNDPITVRVNSYGGSFADGIAIYNALKRHEAPINVEIDGYAYSMASYIAMVGDRVAMAENAMLMVHAPWSVASGNAEDLREAAETLDRHATALAAGYSRGGQVDASKIDTWLSGEKDFYFTAEEAKAEGLIDAVINALPIAASGTLAQLRGRGVTEMNQQVDAARNEARAQERQRIQDIDEALVMPSVVAALKPEDRQRIRAEAVDKGYALGKVHAEILKAMPAEPVSSGGSAGGAHAGQRVGDIRMGRDAIDKATVGMERALLVKGNLDQSREARADLRQNEFAGMPLAEMARYCLEMRGHSVRGLSRMEIIGKAFTVRGDLGITHSTSDFPALLENIATKAVLRGWEEPEETWRLIARTGNLPDFKQATRVALNTYPTLPELKENGEFTYATMGDRGNPIILARYGSIIGLDRTLVINDDLGELTRIPMEQGRAASRRVGDLVYLVYTGNPIMGEDGLPLFDAGHSNIATVAGPPTVETLDDARQLMALQKSDAEADEHGLNIRIANAIVPIALETNTRVLQAAQNDPNAPRDGVPNPFNGQFQTVADARLDAVSQTAWYAAANPQTKDTIEIAFLDGNPNPRLEQKEGWTIDGMELKVALDAGAAPLDYRTAVYNPGA